MRVYKANSRLNQTGGAALASRIRPLTPSSNKISFLPASGPTTTRNKFLGMASSITMAGEFGIGAGILGHLNYNESHHSWAIELGQ